MQRLSQKIEVPVKLEKKDQVHSLIIGDTKMVIPSAHILRDSMFDDDTIQGVLKTEVIFEVKHRKGKPVLLTEADGESISFSNLSIDLKEVELGDFLGDSNFYAQGDLFDKAMTSLLETKLGIGEFDHLISRDGQIWDDEEEQLAYEIYTKSGNGRDSAIMKELINEAIETGNLKREYNSIKMKVYQYQAEDEGENVDGLKNVSKKIRETIDKNR